jgi:hypothetical protein
MKDTVIDLFLMAVLLAFIVMGLWVLGVRV